MDPIWPKFNAPSCCQALAHDPAFKHVKTQLQGPKAPQDSEPASALQLFKKLVSLGPQNDLFFLLEADFIKGPQNGPNLAQVQRSIMLSSIGP